jgi:3-hydroxyacyl-[acyl-carrier-protein] dehydratase
MHFALIDTILEQSPDRIRALKQVTLAEEYLQDHFPTFQVLPGVFMLEAMVQAARALLEAQGHPRMVLGGAKAMRYGSFVRPGEALEVDVQLEKALPDGSFQFKGTGTVRRQRPVGQGQGQGEGQGDGEPETAVSGRFTLRPLRIPPQNPSQG